MSSELILSAPLSGYVVPLAEVPDPVFAAGSVGAGVALEPTEQLLRAPCAGKVIQLHRAHHALTLQTETGVEVLLHVGLDTVTLKGDGFKPLCAEGDHVNAQAPLIQFDAEVLAERARSLMVMMVVPSGEAVTVCAKGSVLAGSSLLKVSAKTQLAEKIAISSDKHETKPFAIDDKDGLHARPAAKLAETAKELLKPGQAIELWCRGAKADVRSVIALMALDVRHGDVVHLVGYGVSDAALDSLADLLRASEGHVPALFDAEPPLLRAKPEPGVFKGTVASAGLAFGSLCVLKPEIFDLSAASKGASIETERLNSARERAIADLEKLRDLQGGAEGQIFQAHIEILNDPALFDEASVLVNQGKSAELAWREATDVQATKLLKLDNALLRARAADLRDLAIRMLCALENRRPNVESLPNDAILVADELTPSALVTLDRSRLRGIATVGGGPASHTAIIANSMGIPMLCGMDPAVLSLENNKSAVLDTAHGLMIDCDLEQVRAEIAAKEAARKAAFEVRANEAITVDGQKITVLANIQNPADAKDAVELGAEGVGLFRTELLYVNQRVAPSIEEQKSSICEIFDALAGRPLTVRTLDVGGDKPLAYLPLEAEQNPFLGLRGVRVSLEKPALLRMQMRALLEAAKASSKPIKIMLPMISRREELLAVRALVNEERAKVGNVDLKLGVMIEVPAAALQADVLARDADFFSIGTNDLTQYTMAVDRGHPMLGALCDPLDPAVLKLIQMTVLAAKKHNRSVSVCGGLASDPLGIPILLGLGVTELSVSLSAIPIVKAQLRTLSLARCQAWAEQALTLVSAQEVRAAASLAELTSGGAK